MTERKFYRQVVQVEILSEEPFDDITDLDTIHYNITEGHQSGRVSIVSTEEVNGKDMAILLQNQDSDPEFFNLDENGNDV